VERVVFSAGEAAVNAAQETERALGETAEVFGVPRGDVPETARRFFEEWKERGKEIEELRAELAELRTEEADEEEVGGVSLVAQRMDADIDELRSAANSVVEEGKVAVFAGRNGSAGVVVGVPDGIDVDAGEVAGELASMLGGDGGGSPEFGQGGGPDIENIDEALERSKKIIKEEL
jgi:alanyl-tRNA synthetase